ncbi:MFS general substrate transporter [Trametes versicolor FP-101664 SS1]|uniref:MFS general substrate transporter n=1 Tax=Trametes versicolor (strain FP-101664) TaxID=717944 RepID=UPI0004623B4B|nr:MFS general substrate transporter [Trametes versicolor FP-101664 SS1]EIW63416.1 MFS general substrate transporter [Trametes versicolor FP-101664 SS1]
MRFQHPTLQVIAAHHVRMSSQESEVTAGADVEKSQAHAPVAGDDGKASDAFEVKLEPADDPKFLSLWHKWLAVLVISTATLCVTFDSSMAAFTEQGLAIDLHASQEVTILGVSLYVLGLGIGPLFVGPLSELYGRNVIYQVSYWLFFAFTWPTAFPPDIATFLVFRFITGLCSSAFFSVAGGSVSDLFDNRNVGTPMAVYTLSQFVGPVLGPVMAGYLRQNADWRWCYRVLLIWQFVLCILLTFCVPETYAPVIVKRKAQKLRKTTGDNRYYAPLERSEDSLARMILFSCSTPFKLLMFDRMALALDVWSALLLGILYLAFQAFPIIFQEIHGFNIQSTGLAFIGIGVGVIAGLSTQPYWNSRVRQEAEKHGGHPPPEVHLLIAQPGGIIAPIGLFVMAFTTYPRAHWIGPIIGSGIFGAGMYYIYTGVFTYLVTAYRPIAASAMAANSALRSSFAAVFPLFAGQMYHRLGTVGATALLAGLTTLMSPLPFIFYRTGGKLRANSRFAVA